MYNSIYKCIIVICITYIIYMICMFVVVVLAKCICSSVERSNKQFKSESIYLLMQLITILDCRPFTVPLLSANSISDILWSMVPVGGAHIRGPGCHELLDYHYGHRAPHRAEEVFARAYPDGS